MALAVLVAAWEWNVYSREVRHQEHRSRREHALAQSTVQMDRLGRIVLVRARSARHALEAFCARGPRTAVELIVLAEPGRRLGVFRLAAAESALRAVEIRRGDAVDEWLIGNGSSPVDVSRVPALPAGTPRLRLHP